MSKSCDAVRQNLSAYIDDMLSVQEADEVKKHLAECAMCKEEYEFICGIIKSANELPELSVSDSFHCHLHEKLVAVAAEKKAVKVRKRPLWQLTSGLVAAAAVIALSVVSFSHVPKQSELTPVVPTPGVTQVEEKNINEINESAATTVPAATAEPAKTAEPVKATGTVTTVQPKKTQASQITAEPVREVEPTPAEHKAVKPIDEKKPEPVVVNPVPERAPQPTSVPELPNNSEQSAGSQEPVAYVNEAAEPELDKAQPVESALAETDQKPKISSGAKAAEEQEPVFAAAFGGNTAAYHDNKDSSSSFSAMSIHYTLNETAYAQGIALLEGYQPAQNGYLVPDSQLTAVCQKLESLSGYMGHSNSSIVLDQLTVEKKRLYETHTLIIIKCN